MNSLSLIRKTGALASVLCLLAAASCSEKTGPEEDSPTGNEPEVSFSVTGFTPAKGGHDTEVTFKGSGFGNDKDNVKILFNEKEAGIKSVKDDEIIATVPSLPGEECIVTVTIGEENLRCGKTFDYLLSMGVSTLTGGKFNNSNPSGKPDNKPIVSENPKGETPLADAAFAGNMDSNIYADSQGNVYFSVKGASGNTADVYKANYETGILTRILEYDVTHTSLVLGYDASKDMIYGMKAHAWYGDWFTYDCKSGTLTQSDDDNKISWDSTEGFPENNESAGDAIRGMAVQPGTGLIYVKVNGVLGMIDPATWKGTNLGKPKSDSDNYSYGLAFDNSNSDILYFSNENDGVVWKYSLSTGDCTRFAGSGYGNLDDFGDGELGGSMFNHPRQICMDNAGNMYVADEWHCCIRKISIAGQTISTYAGQSGESQEGYRNGELSEALFDDPVGVAVDSKGVIYVADRDNYAIRRIALE